jgi:hypothetical protein
MTEEYIYREILVSSDKPDDLKLLQLIKTLAGADQEAIAEAVIQVFENTNRPNTLFRDQEFAGSVLHEINPTSTQDLRIVLQRTLKNWNKSIEQFPFWLRDNYGLDTIKEIFNKIEWSSEEQDKLETMKWWLQLSLLNSPVSDLNTHISILISQLSLLRTRSAAPPHYTLSK